jgi:hypothetical protein
LKSGTQGQVLGVVGNKRFTLYDILAGNHIKRRPTSILFWKDMNIGFEDANYIELAQEGILCWRQ